IFQPELRRALERIGRVGSFGWLLSPAETRAAVHVSNEVARAAAELSSEGQGALIVLQRETGLQEVAETGVMVHGDVSADLLVTIFTPKSPLHDGAVIIREDRIVAAGTLLPLAETSIHTERFGTRHRAALGITEQTDAVVVVVSEENGQISLVERARIVRNLTETGLARAIQGLLDPASAGRGAFGWRSARPQDLAGRAPRLRELGRFVRRPTGPRQSQATVQPPASSPNATPPAPTPVGTADSGATSIAGTAAVPAPPTATRPRAPTGRATKAKAPSRAANDDDIVASRPARAPR
ncbi:MAG: diadenylate cyclase, partial [Chloroflexota bacterium]